MKTALISLRPLSHKWALIAPYGLLLGLCAPCGAAGKSPDGAALKTHVAAQEKRADLMRDELRACDKRIEERIENMVGALKSVADSHDSRTKVVRMKESTIEQLRKSVEDCRRRRASLQEELRRPTMNLTAEQKNRGIAAFDAAIEKRIAQIIELYGSLPQHQDYEKYKVVPGGWYGPLYMENQDWKQNQMVVSHTNTTRDKLIDAIKASTARLDRQSRDLRTQLAVVQDESQRTALNEELQKNEATLLKRREQLAEVVKTTGDAPSPSISLKQALTLDQALGKAVEGLRIETSNLFELYSEYVKELVSLNTSRSALASAQAASPKSQGKSP